jgi:DNA-binding MarR family transcriptional regulator
LRGQLLIGQQHSALEAWVRLLRGHASLRRSLSAQLQEEHGLGISEYEALLLLARADGGLMRRVDLAEGLGLSPSGVTRLLDGLEAGGLVEKGTCESDLRVTYAVLTDTGRQRLERSSSSHLAAIASVFEERYAPDELATLAELLARLPGAAAADADECGVS